MRVRRPRMCITARWSVRLLPPLPMCRCLCPHRWHPIQNRRPPLPRPHCRHRPPYHHRPHPRPRPLCTRRVVRCLRPCTVRCPRRCVGRCAHSDTRNSSRTICSVTGLGARPAIGCARWRRSQRYECVRWSDRVGCEARQRIATSTSARVSSYSFSTVKQSFVEHFIVFARQNKENSVSTPLFSRLIILSLPIRTIRMPAPAPAVGGPALRTGRGRHAPAARAQRRGARRPPAAAQATGRATHRYGLHMLSGGG
jgi:hypothetical protein